MTGLFTNVFFTTSDGLALYNYDPSLVFDTRYTLAEDVTQIGDFILSSREKKNDPRDCDFLAYSVTRKEPYSIFIKKVEPLETLGIDLAPYAVYSRSRLTAKFTATSEQVKKLALRFLDTPSNIDKYQEIIDNLDPRYLWLKLDGKDKKVLRAVIRVSDDSNPARLALVDYSDFERRSRYFGYELTNELEFFWLSSKGVSMSAIPYEDGTYCVCCKRDYDSAYLKYCLYNLTKLEDDRFDVILEEN